VCCHYCRISQNRKRKKHVPYLNCRFCSNVFCYNCVVNHLGLNFEETKNDPNFKCLPCKEQCCCCKSECTLDHRHCFTSIRTKKRYAKARELKMKQLQLRRRQHLTDDSDYVDDNEFLDECSLDVTSPSPSHPAPTTPVNQRQSITEVSPLSISSEGNFRFPQINSISLVGFGPGYISNSNLHTNRNPLWNQPPVNNLPGVLIDLQSLAARSPSPIQNYSTSLATQSFAPYKRRPSPENPCISEEPFLKKAKTLYQSTDSPNLTVKQNPENEKEDTQLKSSTVAVESCSLSGQTSAFVPRSTFVKRPFVPIVYHNEKLTNSQSNSSPNALNPSDKFIPRGSVLAPEKNDTLQRPMSNPVLPPLSQALASSSSPLYSPSSLFEIHHNSHQNAPTTNSISSHSLNALPPLAAANSSALRDNSNGLPPPSSLLLPPPSISLIPWQNSLKTNSPWVSLSRENSGALQIPAPLRLQSDHIVMKTMVSAN
jgi:hypothetical protein